MFVVRQEQMTRMSIALNRSVVMPCDRHWIEIVLYDEGGNAVPNTRYEITLSDGSVVAGHLDDKGEAKLENIPAGCCSVTFPELDADAWRPA
jgi:hypothetical protein